MSSHDVLEKLEALDLSKLTEVERQSGVAEVRAQLAAIAAGPRSAEQLARKVAFLKLWQKLLRLRVIDVHNNVPPPGIRPDTVRMFPPGEGDEIIDETPAAADVAKEVAVEPALEGLVKMRLLKPATVKGMKLPEGITIEVEADDARELLDANGAILVSEDALPPK
jgi:hypothetical protein